MADFDSGCIQGTASLSRDGDDEVFGDIHPLDCLVNVLDLTLGIGDGIGTSQGESAVTASYQRDIYLNTGNGK